MKKTRDNEKMRHKSATNMRISETREMTKVAPSKSAQKHMRHRPYA